MLCRTLVLFVLLQWSEAYYGEQPRSQKELVKQLRVIGEIKHKLVEKVMQSVDRKYYVKRDPYEDEEQHIGFDATFNSPRIDAFTLETLWRHLKRGSRVLEVGSGTGYMTVCLALLAGEGGSVIGLDHIPELVDMARKNVWRDKPLLMKRKQVRFLVADGRLGYAAGAPYDVIHVSVSEPCVPKTLVRQLKPGGRLLMVIQYNFIGIRQEMLIIDKLKNGTVTRRLHKGVFVNGEYSVGALNDKDKNQDFKFKQCKPFRIRESIWRKKNRKAKMNQKQ